MTRTAPSSRGWIPLTAGARDQIVAARLQLHGAAQLPAAAAAALLRAAADGGHASLRWEPGGGALWTHAAADGRRAGLALRSVELLAAGGPETAGAVQRLPLAGRTVQDALGWLAGCLGLTAPPDLPCHDLPAIPALSGAPFEGPGPGCDSIAAWFHDAALVLEALAAARPGAGPVRCWPHHFDIAVREPLGPAGDGGGRSVGAGMTPGDAVFPLPYFYVLPWPKPDPGGLTPLPEGAWYTGSWVGALLAAHDLLGAGPEQQEGRVRTFLAAATAAARSLLTRPGS